MISYLIEYNGEDNLKNILNAIASCITNSDNPFVAIVVNDSIVIEDYAHGYRRNSVSFGISANNISTNFIQIVSGFQSDLGLNNTTAQNANDATFANNTAPDTSKIYLAAGCVGNTEILSRSSFLELNKSSTYSKYLTII